MGMASSGSAHTHTGSCFAFINNHPTQSNIALSLCVCVRARLRDSVLHGEKGFVICDFLVASFILFLLSPTASERR